MCSVCVPLASRCLSTTSPMTGTVTQWSPTVHVAVAREKDSRLLPFFFHVGYVAGPSSKDVRTRLAHVIKGAFNATFNATFNAAFNATLGDRQRPGIVRVSTGLKLFLAVIRGRRP